MIDGIGDLVIGLKLGYLKVPKEWLLYYPRCKGWLAVEPFVGLCQGGIVESILDLFIECPKFSLYGKIPDDAGFRILRRMVTKG